MMSFLKRWILLLLLVNAASLFAQGGAKRVFNAIGGTTFADYVVLPVDSFMYKDPQTGNVSPIFIRPKGLSLLTAVYTANVMLPIADEVAISYAFAPAVSVLVLEGGGFGAFNLASYAAISLGAGATYFSDKRMGGFVGGGVEVNYAPIEYNVQSLVLRNYAWINPVLIAGLRFKTQTTELFEINFKFGFGKPKEYAADISQQSTYERAFTARATFLYFLDW